MLSCPLLPSPLEDRDKHLFRYSLPLNQTYSQNETELLWEMHLLLKHCKKTAVRMHLYCYIDKTFLTHTKKKVCCIASFVSFHRNHYSNVSRLSGEFWIAQTSDYDSCVINSI